MKGLRGRHVPALSLTVALCGTAGCSYDYPEPLHPPATSPSQGRESAAPYPDPRVLEREVKNYAQLDRLLKAVPGPVLLFEEGPWMDPSGALARRRRCRRPACIPSPQPVLVLPARRSPLDRSTPEPPSARRSSRWIARGQRRGSLHLSRGTFSRTWCCPAPAIRPGRGQWEEFA